MRLYPALLLALAACVHRPLGPAPEPVEARSRRGPPMCHWSNVAWLQSLELRLPYLGSPFATANGARTPPAFTGVLRSDSSEGTVLEGFLHGDRIHLAFELDATALPVLRLDHPSALGGSGLIVAGGSVGALGPGAKGLVKVRPPGWAMEWIEAGSTPLTAEVPCQELDLLPAPPQPADTDMDAAILKAAKLADGARELDVAPQVALPLHESPGGNVAFSLKPSDYGHSAWKIGEAPGGWQKLAWVHWTGSVLWGWVAPEDATRLQPPTEGQGGLGIGGISKAAAPPPALQACNEPQALFASVSTGQRVPVGNIDAGRSFQVVAPPADGVVQVLFPGSWLRPAEKGRLYLPERAASCPGLTSAAPAQDGNPVR